MRIAVFTVVFSLLFGIGPNSRADESVVVELWPGGAPDELGELGDEEVRMSPKLERRLTETTESTRMITNVTKPTITVRRPSPETDTGTAMLIFPGGGYWNLYWEVEGEEVANWLTSNGITAILLKYRVPRRPGEPEREPAMRPLQDAQRAVSLVRSKAREWGIHPNRIGVVGFSAGGHLAISTATRFERRAYEPQDEIDTISCRPDFAVAVYSGYLKAADKDELGFGLTVPKETPPVFLVHGGDDVISSPEHSVVMYLALKRAGIPAELHVYSSSTHGFGVRPSDRPHAAWPTTCIGWLVHQNLRQARAAGNEQGTLQTPQSFSGAQAGDGRAVAGVQLCWCPPGKFTMGSSRSEPERRPGEDQVEVTLTNGFWMAKYETTQRDWKRIVGKLPGDFTLELPEGDDLPVGNVNFGEAELFCIKLTEQSHASSELPKDWEFRLPTEAQWEYACRAGTTTATSFGDSISSQQANFKGDRPYNGGELGPSLNKAAPVGSYPANPWGLHDMHGNTCEWCRDWFHAKLPGGADPDLYWAKATAQKNRTGDWSRSRRGSCWADEGWPSRSAFRQRFEPERRYDHIGYREVAVKLRTSAGK